MDKLEALKTYFGHTEFRQGQERIVDCLLSGGDALCVMPTGAGKSICYQLPAALMPGVALVISPLISLMKDQVQALNQTGIRAAYINSSLTPGQCRKAMANMAQGMYRVVYVAPERLDTEEFQAVCRELPLSLMAVDEAHCVSQWGHDFRPAYLRIADFIDGLPKRPAVAAFTATATDRVKDDIYRMLRLKEPLRITTGFDRPNLFFGVLEPVDKDRELLRLLAERRGRSGVIYCMTRKAVEQVHLLLCREGYAATRYHAGLSDEERMRNQDDFLYDRSPIMVATNAFGMGIDKPNVTFVIHYNMPKNLESYYQEAGRAGRDGSASDCILLYAPKDMKLAEYMIKNTEAPEETDPAERARLLMGEEQRLKQMTIYSTTGDCLRSTLLRYFGEETPPVCGGCSACCPEFFYHATPQRPRETKAAQSLKFADKTEPGIGTERRNRDRYGKRDDGDFTGMSGEAIRNAMIARLKAQTQPEEPPDEALFEKLKLLRREMADKAGVPAFVIFSDVSLRDMSRKKPQTVADFLSVSGVGKEKQKRYGEAFTAVIRQHLREGEKKQ